MRLKIKKPLIILVEFQSNPSSKKISPRLRLLTSRVNILPSVQSTYIVLCIKILVPYIVYSSKHKYSNSLPFKLIIFYLLFDQYMILFFIIISLIYFLSKQLPIFVILSYVLLITLIKGKSQNTLSFLFL